MVETGDSRIADDGFEYYGDLDGEVAGEDRVLVD